MSINLRADLLFFKPVTNFFLMFLSLAITEPVPSDSRNTAY